MSKKLKLKLFEILLLVAVLAVYSFVFYKYFSMLPGQSDPLQYIEPSVRKTLIGYFPLIDRLMVADGVRLVSLLFHRVEIAGAVYFGAVNLLILIIAMVWAYLKKGFWTAFLVGVFLTISYPLLRYANYGYPDATVALYGLVAFICYVAKNRKKLVFWTGFFATMALFSKITGLAIILYFIFDLVYEKKYFELINFFIGVFTSVAVILLSTGLLFNFDSLKYVFTKVSQNISANTEPRSVARSLLYTLRPEVILPGYLALIVFFKAYKDQLIRKIFLLSIFFIGFFTLLVIFSSHVKIYPHYLYTASVFATIGMAFYLGNLTNGLKNKKTQFVLAIITLILVILGFGLGLPNSNHFIINGLSDLMALSLYLKIIYSIFPLIILGLMVGITKYQSKIWIVAFILFIALGGSFFTSASAYSVVNQQKKEIIYSYKYAEAFTQTSGDFRVYETSGTKERQQQVALVYFLFYNQDTNLSQIKRTDMLDRIKFIKKEEITSQKGFIVTEDPATVLSLDPAAKISKEIKWSEGQIAIIEI